MAMPKYGKYNIIPATCDYNNGKNRNINVI